MRIESINLIFEAIRHSTIGIADLWGIASSIYQLPGNLLLEAVGHIPEVANLFHIEASQETGYASLGGWFSNLFSLFVWLALLVMFSSLSPERNETGPRQDPIHE